jgi:hypothetical protein
MKKRAFLAPLAVSVASLLGGAPVPAHATVSTTPSVEKISASTAAGADFVLRRNSSNGVQIADHESHYSHESHSSHSSHYSSR